MSRVSPRLDGVTFDLFRARHSGTVEIDAEQADQLAIGEVIVTVDVSTVSDVQAKLDKDGNMARIAVLKHSETVVVDGDIKKVLVEQLGLYGGDTMPPPIRITPGERTPAQREANGSQDIGSGVFKHGGDLLDEQAARDLLENGESVSVTFADEETGEIIDEYADEEAQWASRQPAAETPPQPHQSSSPETIESPGAQRLGQIPGSVGLGAGRPQANSPQAFVSVAESGTETLGRITVKDSALAWALESGGWS